MVERMFGSDDVGDTFDVAAIDLHNAALGGVEDARSELRDGIGIGADILINRVDIGDSALLIDLGDPYTIGAEDIDIGIAELTLREWFGDCGDAVDGAGADGVDAGDWEEEGVVDLGGVEFVGERDYIVARSLNIQCWRFSKRLWVEVVKIIRPI